MNPQFLRLPSGTVINLALVRRVVDNDRSATVYFDESDSIALDAVDAEALRKTIRARMLGGVASNVKVAVFWCVILVAIVLVYMAIHTAR